MYQVKVCFCPVLRDKDLAVLVRGHGAGVNVKVRVKLLHRHRKSTAFQKPSYGGEADTLTNRTHHAARHKYIFRHVSHIVLPGYSTPTSVYDLPHVKKKGTIGLV
jgi:hypothetical protein